MITSLKIYDSQKIISFDLMQKGFFASNLKGLGQQYNNTLVYNKARYYNQYREFKYPDFSFQLIFGLNKGISRNLYHQFLDFLNSDETYSFYFESLHDSYYFDIRLSQATQNELKSGVLIEQFTFNRLSPKYDWVDESSFVSYNYPLAIYNNTEHPIRPIVVESMKLENDNPPYLTQIDATPKNLAIVTDWMTLRTVYNGNGISAYYDKLTNELVINGYGTTEVEFDLNFDNLAKGNMILSIIPNQDIESGINVWGKSDKTGPSILNLTGTTYFYSYQLPFYLLHFQLAEKLYYKNYRIKFQVEQRLLTDNLLYNPANLTTKVPYQVDIGVPFDYLISENLFSAGTMTISVDRIPYDEGDYNLLINCDLNEKITVSFSSNSGTQNSSFHIVNENTGQAIYTVNSTNGIMNVNYTFTTAGTNYRIIFRCYYQDDTTFSVSNFKMNYGNLTGWRNIGHIVSGTNNEYRLIVDFNPATWEIRISGKITNSSGRYVYPLYANPFFENASMIYEYISGNFSSTGNGQFRLWVFADGLYTGETSLNIFKNPGNIQTNILDNYYFVSKSVNNLRIQILDSGVSTYDNLIFKVSLFNKNITNMNNYIGDKFIPGLSTATPYSSPYIESQTIKFLNNSQIFKYVNDTLIVDSENKKHIFNGNNNYNNVDKSENTFLNVTDDMVVRVGDEQFLNIKYKKWRND